MRYIVGTGVLNWSPSERRSDRYGAVGVFGGGSSNRWDDPATRPLHLGSLLTTRGRVGVTIIEGRTSSHIGDFFHGFHQRKTPNDGAEIYLGEVGALRIEIAPGGGQALACVPDDGRDTFWFDPEVLYDVHESLVELWIEDDA